MVFEIEKNCLVKDRLLPFFIFPTTTINQPIKNGTINVALKSKVKQLFKPNCDFIAIFYLLLSTILVEFV